MEVEGLVRRLIDMLTSAISCLAEHGPEGLLDDLHETYSIQAARRMWSLLGPVMASHNELKDSLRVFAAEPENEDTRKALEVVVKDLLSLNAALARDIESLLKDLEKPSELRRAVRTPLTQYLLDPTNETLRRLEILKLIRSEIDPARIAGRFNIHVSEVFRINYDYSVAGVRGAMMPAENRPTWIEQLDPNDPLLRRLEMVRLLRAGTPASAVARQFDALEDYVLLIGQEFARLGLPGIMTEYDIERFRSIHPDEIRICSYNLQGVGKDGAFRFRRMARELSTYRPDLIAFQEVVSGAGIDDTSLQVARWLSSMTGEHYGSHFTYCHQFMDKYPEGVGICARVPVKRVTNIDLTANLAKGLRPSMDRCAQMAETTVSNKEVILVSVHLDHIEAGGVRRAQTEKLLSELDRLTRDIDYYALILAGDFNDLDDSPALRLLKSAGYTDAYRVCHKTGGNTFPVPKPNARIDYILVKGQAEVVSAEVILNDPDLSDHLGVAVVLR